jgi:hypothetical protein
MATKADPITNDVEHADFLDPVMNHVEYAEVLVGKALSFTRRSKASRKAKSALLLSALRELQAERGERVTVVASPSG